MTLLRELLGALGRAFRRRLAKDSGAREHWVQRRSDRRREKLFPMF
jgi:hypothetical protein